MYKKGSVLKILAILTILLATVTGYAYAEETIELENETLEQQTDEVNSDTYFGILDCNLWNIHVGQDKNGYYINGNVDICEWVNDKVRPLSEKPKIELVSTDGKIVKEFKVELRKQYDWGSEYYFYLDIDGIDIWKEYKVKITDVDTNNTNTSNSKEATIPNWTIGNYWEFIVETKNSEIYFNNTLTYIGYTDCNLWNIKLGHDHNGYYLYGNIDICEWVNGKTRPLSNKPIIELIYEDGKSLNQCYREIVKQYDWGTEYYFAVNITGIDITKGYKIRINNTDVNNINSDTYKIANININRIGQYYEYNIDVKDKDTIYFTPDTYVGYIDCNLWEIGVEELLSGHSFIYGCIDICEWVDNKTRPIANPIMELESEDGSIYHEIYLELTNTYDWGSEYIFVVCIDDIDPTKEYKIKVKNDDIKNINPVKTKEATIKAEEIGAHKEYSVYVKDNNTIYFEEDSYVGYIDCNLWNIGIKQTNEYGYVMYGYIDVCEWVDGKTRQLYAVPEILLVDVDGNIYDSAYVLITDKYDWGGGQYYFEIAIEGIDIWKEYAIIVENMDIRNTNPDTMIVPSINTNRIGRYWEYNIEVKDNFIMYFNFDKNIY